MFKERIKTHHSAMADGKKYLIGPRSVVDVLSSTNEKDDGLSTIYIHVPFCAKICSFCNMRRSLQKPSNNYADLIVEEIKQYGQLPYIQSTRFDAIYFGGGTPTMLPEEDLMKILRALKQNFQLTEDVEISIETTVSQLTDSKLETLIAEGANRFSVGVQTFDDAGRKLMARLGSGEAAYKKLEQIKRYPNVTVSMDLIYNYPNQTIENLQRDLDCISQLNLDGFSMYSLIDMKETRIDAAQGEVNDEVMFMTISETMEKAGYRFLELTKMVKDDKYKYVMNRHQGANTLPLGAGAGGSVKGLAMMNPIALSEYEESVHNFTQRKGMLFHEDYKEIVKFKGAVQTIHLPTNESLYKDKDQYKSFLCDLQSHGMVEEIGTKYRLTNKGIFWGNTISRELSKMIIS